MKTDMIDLWQVHALETYGDVDNRIENGIMDVMQEAKESGRVRYIGFTGHSHPDVHLRMLKLGEKTIPFDACQMPVNVMDADFNSFITRTLPALLDRNMGILAMKTLAEGRFYKSMIEDVDYRESHDAVIPDRISLKEALYYAWTLPVSVLITGAEIPEYIEDKIQYARSFAAIDQDRMLELAGKVADLADFAVEEYKKSDQQILEE